MSTLISRGFGASQRIIKRGFFSAVAGVGFLKGELSIDSAYNTKLSVTSALDGDIKVSSAFDGEIKINGIIS